MLSELVMAQQTIHQMHGTLSLYTHTHTNIVLNALANREVIVLGCQHQFQRCAHAKRPRWHEEQIKARALCQLVVARQRVHSDTHTHTHTHKHTQTDTLP